MTRPMTEKEVAMLWVTNDVKLNLRHIKDQDQWDLIGYNKLYESKFTISNKSSGYIYSASLTYIDLIYDFEYQATDGTWKRFEVEELSKEEQVLSDFADLLEKHDVKLAINSNSQDYMNDFIIATFENSELDITVLDVDNVKAKITASDIRKLIKEKSNV